MMFALALAMFAFAFGSPLRTYARILVLAATPITAVACNVVRLVPTVWLYGYYPSDLAGTFHDVSGWVMLVVAFLLLLAIVRLLRWAMVPVTEYTLAYD
jgi:exosortase/archaeosortase family protein